MAESEDVKGEVRDEHVWWEMVSTGEFSKEFGMSVEEMGIYGDMKREKMRCG